MREGKFVCMRVHVRVRACVCGTACMRHARRPPVMSSWLMYSRKASSCGEGEREGRKGEHANLGRERAQTTTHPTAVAAPAAPRLPSGGRPRHASPQERKQEHPKTNSRWATPPHLDIRLCEDEADRLPLDTCNLVQALQATAVALSRRLSPRGRRASRHIRTAGRRRAAT